MWWPCFSSDIWGLNCLRNIQVGNSLEPSQIDAVSSSEWNVLWVKCILHLCRLHYQFCLLLVMLNGFCKGNHNTQGSSKSEVKLGRISSKDMMWFDLLVQLLTCVPLVNHLDLKVKNHLSFGEKIAKTEHWTLCYHKNSATRVENKPTKQASTTSRDCFNGKPAWILSHSYRLWSQIGTLTISTAHINSWINHR